MTPSLSNACIPATFGLPSIFGAEILSLTANIVTNYTASVPDAYRFTQPSTEVTNATICNVTVSYTHPGQDDNIFVEAWLPVDKWNGRFQAVGGGGWVAGRFFLSYSAMAGAIADGYATITTDAGLGSAADASPWALLSPGNVNLYNLDNLGSRSLDDEVSAKTRCLEFRLPQLTGQNRQLLGSPSFEASTARTRPFPIGTVARKAADRACS